MLLLRNLTALDVWDATTQDVSDTFRFARETAAVDSPPCVVLCLARSRDVGCDATQGVGGTFRVARETAVIDLPPCVLVLPKYRCREAPSTTQAHRQLLAPRFTRITR